MQHQGLVQKLRGHIGYFAITGNFRLVQCFCKEAVHAWHKWLSRRSQRARMPWDRMRRLLERYPLPRPRILRPYGPPQ